MKFSQYKIVEKVLDTEDTFIFRLKPIENEILSFLPGQYTYLRNPLFSSPFEEHPFSFASSPLQKDYLEFCIKIRGDWTNEVTQLEVGAILEVSAPLGKFTLRDNAPFLVFLVGGVGIPPIVSMLRYLRDSKLDTEVVLVYGNRTPDTINYKNTLRELQGKIDLKIVYVYSDIEDRSDLDNLSSELQGYTGFITPSIIEKEVNLEKKPVFYLIGPTVFIEYIREELEKLQIQKDHIKYELIPVKVT
jgi:ferredoxin-NADP reductase